MRRGKRLIMKKKIIQLVYLLLFLPLLVQKNVYAQDYFGQLEALKIGDFLPQTLGQQGELVENGNPNTTYLRFQSASFAYPHYVEVNNSNNKIIYIELKIPETHLEKYESYLNSLGEPETKLVKTPSYILLGYPSQGIGFIVSETSKNFIIFIQYPPKTVEELSSNEGENFIPVSQRDTSISEPSLTPPASKLGDTDSDGDVDIFDYNILIENFGSTNCGHLADLNDNCKVDIFDYNILLENFGL